ncbi:lipase/serine esterase [Purpureocillium lavendulum]|uniref:Lipase/serine esterase n=1 Tax=Purpureocillium lavendulum TaxID=1247861 RepID=A0AB34G1Y8_9HYPO|nr:lipase/serine esterase [Purpureocillium lavendulum]
MLLLHQVGSVKIGEVVRYTVTYTPSQDRILPSPEKLFVRIRNTSAIALRAAFVHGPYTLAVSAYPEAFSPNERFPNPRRYGVPQYEPMLKAGGSWECELVVPDDIRQAAGTGRHGHFGKSPEHDAESASWIIEVSSQVIFSTSVAVGYELVVARDRKSLSLSSSLPVVGSQSQVPTPGKVADLQQSAGAKDGHHPAQPRGVFSRAVHVTVEDTASLWNTPRLPGWDDAGKERLQERKGADKPVESVVQTGDPETKEDGMPTKQKKVHLVILTHGLHSNLGADMLFLKESIDASAKQARIDAKARRRRERERAAARGRASPRPDSAGEDAAKADGPPVESNEAEHDSEDGDEDEDEDDDYEQVIVRGYSGNATKTERGIKYLGKRLARYVLSMTYPDQPYLPLGKGSGEGFAEGLKGDHHHKYQDHEVKQAHKHSTIQADMDKARREKHQRPYKITSISFVAHSLGGLVQTYAVAYIQKHSPKFFEQIKPINFIALATPFLGLSNENPLYVKFALDFGLVGRTGQDLGLTWRAPTLARSGWGAIVSNLGESAHKKVYGESQPESKPLLRILPTGPAHTALKKFRNRTVYSNVVNDGIVPLRTSCLLFLDWQGLGRVEKARRDAGLVETVVGFGWAELTGTNMASLRPKQLSHNGEQSESGTTTPRDGNLRQVPQPSGDAMIEDDRASLRSIPTPYTDEDAVSPSTVEPSTGGPLSGFFNLFKSNDPPKEQPISQKQKMILRRGQTMPLDQAPVSPDLSDTSSQSRQPSKSGKATAGHELDEGAQGVAVPPKTTFFESAGDLLNPSVPSVDYVIDPSKRPRTIFHDRVYHPADIPPPPMKKRPATLRRKTLNRTGSASQQSTTSGASSPYPSVNHEDSLTSTKDYDDTAHTNPDKHPDEVVDGSNMRVEEKIARGYHRDLSWRKVLVKLEPDAHNNIFVRRMFPNAYGWPVVKHLVDAHFSDSATARMRTEDEHLGERALDMSQPPDEHGGETKVSAVASSSTLDVAAKADSNGGKSKNSSGSEHRNASEAREALDEVPDLPASQGSESSHPLNNPSGAPAPLAVPRLHSSECADSVTWSERDWIDSDNDSDAADPGDADRHAKAKAADDKKAQKAPQQQQQQPPSLKVQSPQQQPQQTGDGSKDGDNHRQQGGGLSPSSWSWAEKIVGRGARGRSKSPVGTEDPDKKTN